MMEILYETIDMYRAQWDVTTHNITSSYCHLRAGGLIVDIIYKTFDTGHSA